MRHRTESHLPGRCKRCYLKERFCLCAELPRVDTRTFFFLVRHGWEAHKSTNTARIAALALSRSTLVDFAPYDAQGPKGDERLRNIEASVRSMPNPVLLFPGEPSAPTTPPSHLIVLDGTWRQARKMLKRIPALLALPRLSLPAPALAPPRLRRSSAPENMSTLEAIAAAVALLEGEALALPLLALHQRLFERVHLGRSGLAAIYDS